MAIKITKGEARGYLIDYVRSITTETSKGQYACPLPGCNSGKGKNHTGAFSIKDGITWKCFSCDRSGDLFDLVGIHEGLQGFKDQKEWIERWRGVEITSDNETTTTPTPKTTPTDYTKFILEANRHLTETSYHRGISLETLNRFKVGFVPDWKHPAQANKPNAPTTPRLIIPTSSESYLARDTRENIPDEQKPYSKMKAGAMHVFNAEALQEATRPVFVVEGELDAMSIIDVGGEAVALGSTSMVNRFTEMVTRHKPNQALIIALDNDGAGAEAADKLTQGLNNAGITFYRGNVFDPIKGHKDANEFLQEDRDGLTKAVSNVYAAAEQAAREAREAERVSYLQESAQSYIANLSREIKESRTNPVYSTGFKQLDDLLDGGLYEGLHIVGAISSLGKSALVMQIADQLAQQGRDVLYFTLEMSRSRLMCRSISRHTAQYAIDSGLGIQNAKSARGISDGKRYVGYTDPFGVVHRGYDDKEQLVIKEAFEAYSRYANHMFIHEGHGDLGVKDVEEAVKRHISVMGVVPVVVIDYLQILAANDPRATDKQNTDYTVNELARLVRDYRVPVIAVSSFNRGSYNEKVSMTAFKESGLIEYGADVLIGLQFEGAGEKGFDVDKAKNPPNNEPRRIELKILKNRDARTGTSMTFDYYPVFNLFKSSEGVLGWETAIGRPGTRD